MCDTVSGVRSKKEGFSPMPSYPNRKPLICFTPYVYVNVSTKARITLFRPSNKEKRVTKEASAKTPRLTRTKTSTRHNSGDNLLLGVKEDFASHSSSFQEAVVFAQRRRRPHDEIVVAHEQCALWAVKLARTKRWRSPNVGFFRLLFHDLCDEQ